MIFSCHRCRQRHSLTITNLTPKPFQYQVEIGLGGKFHEFEVVGMTQNEQAAQALAKACEEIYTDCAVRVSLVKWGEAD